MSKNRRLTMFSRFPQIPYTGECKEIDTYLSGKKAAGWLIPKFMNSLLRGVAQVLFVNNPLSGLLILLSIFWCDILVGLAVVLSASCAIFTALFIKQDPSLITSGLISYNAVLVGSVTASLWTPLYSENLTPKIWAFIILGSIVSVIVTSAFSNMLASFKIPLPCLTMPFNIVILVLFVSLMPPKIPSTPQSVPVTSNHSESHFGKNEMNWTSGMNTSTTPAAMQIVSLTLPKQLMKNAVSSTAAAASAVSPVAPYLFNRAAREIPSPSEREHLDHFRPTYNHPNVSANSSLIDDEIIPNTTEKAEKVEKVDLLPDDNMLEFSWLETFSGIILSMGQVYAVKGLYASVIIIFAIMIYSPMLCVMCFVGGSIATFTGLLFVTESFDSVFNGIWGYCGVLSAGAIGGFFMVLTFHSFWLAVFNVLFTALIQRALIASFAPMNLPVFTLPFVLSTLIFLSISSVGNQLLRVDNITVPETHRREFLEKQQLEVEGTQAERAHETAFEEIKGSNEEISPEIRTQD